MQWRTRKGLGEEEEHDQAKQIYYVIFIHWGHAGVEKDLKEKLWHWNWTQEIHFSK